MHTLRNTLGIFLGLFLLTAVAYPLLIIGIGTFFFPAQSSGNLLYHNDQVIGARRIGQAFTNDKYFWPRPSANQYDATASGGSNLGPTSAKLLQLVKERKAHLGGGDIPPDLLFASGSGLDPHITPEAAQFQVERVAKARNLDPQKVSDLVDKSSDKLLWRYFGYKRINVLLLNLALDDLDKGTPK